MDKKKYGQLILLVILIVVNSYYMVRTYQLGKETKALISSNDSLKLHIGKLYRDPSLLMDSILTPASLMKYIRLKGIKWPKVVWAQAMVETGYFTCTGCCLQSNNLFGLMEGKGKCMEFTKWQESVDYYARWQMKRFKKNQDYFTFLKQVGYASFKGYTTHIAQILLDNKMSYDDK